LAETAAAADVFEDTNGLRIQFWVEMPAAARTWRGVEHPRWFQDQQHYYCSLLPAMQQQQPLAATCLRTVLQQQQQQ
jgi:hypothetical protein